MGPEAAHNYERRLAEGFISKYVSGDAVLDIGYKGNAVDAVPITGKAIGVDLDFPGYDGKKLPFDDHSQDAVFASHVLEHIDDYRTALADWYRVLKTGGFLVICVPHQYLYERKRGLPSRFNPDHRRFYTPVSLLREVEESLPLAGYRVRTLRDIDDGFDYSVPPEQHARGCYEIELVIEKTVQPTYVERMYPSSVSTKVTRFFNRLLTDGLIALRDGRLAEAEQIQTILGGLPLPPFKLLDCSTEHTERELIDFLAPIVGAVLFDEKQYLADFPQVSRAIADGRFGTAREHYMLHGYFEGRPVNQHGLFE